MIQPNNPLRVVASWCGSGTGETIYQAEDGSIWRSSSENYSTETATAPAPKGALVGGVIFKGGLT